MTEERARRIDGLMDVVDAIHGETLAALYDADHEAMGAMLHTMSQPYRKMSDPGTIDAHNELACRARAYQARIAELEAEIERLKASGD